MKRIILAALLLCVHVSIAHNSNSLVTTFTVYQDIGTLEALTIYNPVKRQCKSNPLTTASGSKIDKAKLRDGQLRWMALSRDMLKRWDGKISYGDTILFQNVDPTIDGEWIVKDTMNKRFCKRGDLLFHEAVRSLGKWENVVVKKRVTINLIIKRPS